MICLLNNVIESPECVRVGVIHYKPERLTEEQRRSGIMLDLTEVDMPKPEERPRKAPVLYCNPKTKALWYEYIDRPPTQEELMSDLLGKIDTLINKQDAIISRLEKLNSSTS